MNIRVRALVVGLCLLCPIVATGQTITQPPAGTNVVAAANDYATKSFQDSWDMNERTDLGYFLHGTDQPLSGFSSFTFASGLFSGTFPGINGGPNLFLLETGFPGAAPVGKIGTNYPIDTATYPRIALRMRSSQSTQMRFWWTIDTIYDSPFLQPSGAIATSSGWKYYFVNLATLPGNAQPWSGLKRSLRFDPFIDSVAGTVDIDWVRLTAAPVSQNIVWSGAANVDIYLAANTTPTNNPANLLGLVATNATGGTYALPVGALAPGDYYVAMRPTGGTGNFVYSPGFYRVNAPATITITAPSEEGSADDFATTILGNPWDMTSLADRDFAAGLTGESIAPVTGAVNEAGTPVPAFTAYNATSTTGIGSFPDPSCQSHGDPVTYLMNEHFRGRNFRIDSSRYRILTAELGVPNFARNICGGSVARVIWSVVGQEFDSVSEDLILNSRAGATVVTKLNLDMAALPVDPASPNQLGWNAGQIDGFRLDAHEFVNPTPFFIKRVKLAALDSAHTSYTIRWTASEASGTVNIYIDNDKDPLNGRTQIAGPTTVTSASGTFNWNTTSLPSGTEYFIYVEFNDGTNTNGVYSKWPVKIDHNPPPTARLTPNRTVLNFGVVPLRTLTPAQIVRVTASAAAPGQPCWTVTSDLPATILVDGLTTTAQKCGSGSFTVSLRDQNYVATGVGFATLTISSTGAVNSPQFVRAWYRISSSSSRPTGLIDTPVNGATVSGSVAFTGWAVDDIGVARVTLCRLAVFGEGAPVDARCGGAAEIYLGDAVSLDDARPDVEAVSPNAAANYRAGWGFLVLTNMLPNQGNGQFTLNVRAYDVEGGFTLLGTRIMTGNNASAPEPFGAIDTPGQGEVIAGTAYINFGWALTPQPKSIPTNGSTINVFVDSLPIGSVSYNHFRQDIASLFPGLVNSNGAVGLRTIDTTAYENGVHTIAWGVTDNQGAATGIGSRFFTIFNTGAALTLASAKPGADFGRTVADMAPLPAAADALRVRRGFSTSAPLRVVPVGLRYTSVWHDAMDRVEVHLGTRERSTDTYEGYLVSGGRLMALPVGSALDRTRGVFSWQPGVGYIGPYELVFIKASADGRRERIPVRIVLEPRRPTTRMAGLTPSRIYRSLFASSLE